jgi:hypothetical protein
VYSASLERLSSLLGPARRMALTDLLFLPLAPTRMNGSEYGGRESDPTLCANRRTN